MVQTVQLVDLPLVLVGPMLRRVDPGSVSVFLALRESRKVTLRVYGTDASGTQPMMVQSGTMWTVKLAEHVHVVTVTATDSSLAPGTIYYYQLYFGAYSRDGGAVPETADDLFSPGIFVTKADPAGARKATEAALLYPPASSSPGSSGPHSSGAPRLPSFATPPADLNQLRIIHGSCRKPHGGGLDMLSALDPMIADVVTDPLKRPHQLLLTGDQIYADDVADGLLALIDANAGLLGFPEEPLPNGAGTMGIWQGRLRPGHRQEVMIDEAKFTSGEAKSHLMTFAEFTGMYLLVWSDLLWPTTLPDFAKVFPDEAKLLKDQPSWTVPLDYATFLQSGWGPERSLRSTYLEEMAGIDAFRAGLGAVRRALAHVPVLTICDDHDVTDDWNITVEWCQRAVLPSGSKLGRRVVTDAMLAYAYFQAWGNTPEQFSQTEPSGQSGRDLIAHTEAWNRLDDTHYHAMGDLLGLPSAFESKTADGITSQTLQRAANALAYHYEIAWTDYQLIVLDTRTWRSFLGGPADPPALLWTDEAFDAMLGSADLGPNAATVIVSPAVVIGMPLMDDLVQPVAKSLKGIYYADVEAWAASTAAYHKLLARCLKPGGKDAGGTVRRNVVLLSGDVHYGFAASARYRAAKPFASGSDPISGSITQLVASSLHNQDWKTAFLHHMGYSPILRGPPRRSLAGWANTSGGRFVVGQEIARLLDNPVLHVRQIAGVPAVTTVGDGPLTVEPEWRVTIKYLMQDAADPAVVVRPGDPVVVDSPDARPAVALDRYVAAAGLLDKYRYSWGSGKQVVGIGNVGEVTFVWPQGAAQTGTASPGGNPAGASEPATNARQVIQTLWWRLGDAKNAAPLTRFVADLDGIPVTVSTPDPTPSDPGAPAPAPPTTGSPPYRGFILRTGDRDGTPPRYDGAERADGPNGQVAALQTDLLELGFGLVGVADGDFGRWTRWTVREFQTYAKGTHVARDTLPNPRPDRYSEALEQTPLPEGDRYAGPVSGVVDNATATAIQRWKNNHWRCPVVIEAWDIVKHQPSIIHQIPATAGNPARAADNIWRADDIQTTGPRVYAVDFSNRYQLPAGHEPDAATHPELRVLGQWGTWRQWDVDWSGAVALPPLHTWPEAEMLPERMLPVVAGAATGPTLADLVTARSDPTLQQAVRDTATRQLSTYKVVRSVAEVEALGYFDVYNSYDTAFMSCGPCHWTMGPTVRGADRARAQHWAVDRGELWAYFAYLQRADPETYQLMTADYGLGVDRLWGIDGHTLWNPGQRKYTAGPTLSDEHGMPTAMPAVVHEFDFFRGWHWAYRISMAGRAANYGGWRRGMWAMARQRVNDILRTPWNSTGEFRLADVAQDNGSRASRIGDVFTSERAMAMVLRWHVLAPAHVTSAGRAGRRMRNALDRAMRARPNLPWNTAPNTWGDAQETELIDALSAESNVIGGGLATSVQQVRNWPTWTPRNNNRNFQLPVNDLPEGERGLLSARGSLQFDSSALAHGIEQ